MSLFAILAALLCLALLIFWHELGHFLAARACGVFVERFSVGFGKSILRWRDKRGTEFCLAILPFGGYVRMYGEDSPSDTDTAISANVKGFNQAHLWQRLAIVLAGPAANILLTWLVLSLLSLQGTTQLRPFVDQPTPATPALKANLKRGDLVVSVDNKSIATWKELELALVSRIGESGTILLNFTRDGVLLHKQLKIENWLSDTHQPHPSAALGLMPWQPQGPPLLAQVLEDSAASAAGLLPGDLVVSIDNKPIANQSALIDIVRSSPGRLLRIDVERTGKLHRLELIPASRPSAHNPDKAHGFIGVGFAPLPWPGDKLLRQEPGILSAFYTGATNSLAIIKLIGISIAKLVTGEIAFSNLSGPVGIVKFAGDSAESGLFSLLAFIAYMSMSLGLLNLLPLPILDGGQALLLIGEGVAGRPLAEIWRTMLMRISMVMLLLLMFVATFNDLIRLW